MKLINCNNDLFYYRWRASIYKLVYIDLLLFLIIYYTLSIIYRFALNEDGKRKFESVVAYCNEYSDLIPLSFILGFYVSIVMTRWWNQYTAIPWPDSIAVFVSATIHGNDERGRLMRRTIVRYVRNEKKLRKIIIASCLQCNLY